MDAIFLGLADKRKHPRTTVDICKGKGVELLLLGFHNKLLNRESAVLEAEVTVAVKVHFVYIINI
jgi:hypothetical protein